MNDEYSDRYDALKFPDGWAWIWDGAHVFWADVEPCGLNEKDILTLRRIVNGKAIRP